MQVVTTRSPINLIVAPLLTLRHFRMGDDLVAGGLPDFAIADYDARGMHCRAFHVLFNVGVYGR
jgi:hypothetical protein